MANKEHLAILKQGVAAWNRWREENPAMKPDLSGADLGWAHLDKANLNKANLSRTNLSRADLIGVDLSGANLSRANLFGTDLSKAHLIGAYLYRAHLDKANLSGADLSGKKTNLSRAHLIGADLSGADLNKANLSGAYLMQTILVKTNLDGANLTNCKVYGISAWDIIGQPNEQLNLIITPPDKPVVTVDNLEVAQFIYLLLNNKKIRHVIDTITSKAVLILGRFTPERKAVLDAIREEIRKHDYLPILFDFEKSASRDITETVSTLAHMARFIIADITDAKSIPQELQRIVPDLPSVPVQPLLLASDYEYGMFEHFKRYPWVLEKYLYRGTKELIATLEVKVIVPAEAKAKELQKS